MNKVIITGVVDSKLEITRRPDGAKSARFRVAVRDATKNKDTGEWIESIEYFDVVTHQMGLVTRLANHCEKGRAVEVVGRLHVQPHSELGESTDQRRVEVVVDARGEIQFTPRSSK